MLIPKKLGIVLLLTVLGFSVLAFGLRINYASSHPVLGGDKRVDKTTARIGEMVTVTIDVNGSGTPIQTIEVIQHPVDVLIMMDCSESYFQEIMTMQNKFSDLVQDLGAMGMNLTVGMITFGNSKSLGECPVNKNGTVNAISTRQLTSDTNSIKTFISSLKAWGQWEPWGDAIWLGNHWAQWRSNTYKIAILVTDEPCDNGRRVPGPLSRDYSEDYDGPALWSEVGTAAVNNIKYITIDSGRGLTTTQLMKVAAQTSGLYYDFSHGEATDFVNVINNTITEVVQGELKETAGHDVIVTDIISPEVELVPGSLSQPPSSQVSNPDGSITLKWNLGDIKYNESARITYRVKMLVSGQVRTNANAYVDYLDWEGNAESITLPTPTVTVPHPTIESCDSAGTENNDFNPGETVYANGINYLPYTIYSVFVVNDTTWTEGMAIPSRIQGSATTVSTDGLGNVLPVAVWNSPLNAGGFDIVVDVNGDGKYESNVDALDDNDVVTAGFLVIPEYWLGTALSLAGCFAAFGAFRVAKRKV